MALVLQATHSSCVDTTVYARSTQEHSSELNFHRLHFRQASAGGYKRARPATEEGADAGEDAALRALAGLLRD